MLRTLRLVIVGQNHLIQSIFYKKVVDSACNLLKVKTEQLSGSRMVVNVLFVSPRDHLADGELDCLVS